MIVRPFLDRLRCKLSPYRAPGFVRRRRYYSPLEKLELRVRALEGTLEETLSNQKRQFEEDLDEAITARSAGNLYDGKKH